MALGYFIKLFRKGNVCVTGLKGTGKDMLIANVVARRREPYVSNVDYTSNDLFTPLDVNALDMGGNTYKNFVNGDVKPYHCPYKDKTDIYISDVGVYFPSQYCNELNRDYKNIPMYMALSRQINDASVHVNVQNLNRCWDKLREMSDTFIYCRWCKVFFGIVVQVVTEYEKYETCLARMAEPKISVPLFNRTARTNAKIYLDQFRNTHGKIKTRLLIYRNKSNYNTRVFKEMLEK